MSGESENGGILGNQDEYVDAKENPRQIDWKAYADKYDLMATNNPSYEENIQLALDHIQQRKLEENANICDLGAGTGNYILALNDVFPNASFTHVDCDHEMCRIASKKYEMAGIKNVDVVEDYVQRAKLQPASFDLILCVNSLYAMNPVELTLRRIRSWLKPSGALFVIDFGAQNNVLDWGWYIFREVSKRKGPYSALKTFLEGTEVIRQNHIGSRSQAAGEYWTHSEDSFREKLNECGFNIIHQSKCYRDYCDLAVCEPSDDLAESSLRKPRRMSN